MTRTGVHRPWRYVSYSEELQEQAPVPAVHVQSPPQEQSWPHWQFRTFDPQLQEAPQLQEFFWHSFVMGISVFEVWTSHTYPGDALRHLNETAILFVGMPRESRTCAGMCG